MRKGLSRFRLPLLAVGFVFLLNPYISVLDILPDFFGWLFVWFALSELAELDDRLEAASQKMLYLAVLSFARICAFFLTVSENSSTVMLASFTFAILETVLLLVFVNDFFGGMEYLLQRYGAFGALEKLPDAKFVTLVFMLAKIVLGFIPDLAAILEYEAYVNISASQMLSEIAGYRPYAILLFSLIVLIAGVWWFSTITKYFRTVRNDAEFMKNVSALYESEVSDNSDELEMKKLSLSFILIAVGFVFFLDFTVSKIQIFQDIIGTLLIYVGVTRIGSKKNDRFSVISFIALTLQAVFAVCFRLFAVTDGKTAGFGAKEIIILGIVSVAYAAANLLFVSEVYAFFTSFAKQKGLKNDRHKTFDTSYIFYAVFLSLSACGCVFPASYEWIVLWKAVCIVVFIALSIKGTWKICDDYAKMN